MACDISVEEVIFSNPVNVSVHPSGQGTDQTQGSVMCVCVCSWLGLHLAE